MSRWFLQAVSLPYQVGARVRRGLYRKGWLTSQHLPGPVVSVGNLTVGGTGKTPVTAYVARLFQDDNQRVAILSRGYGGTRTEVTCLSDGEHLYYKPPEVGDEAFWLARSLPGVSVYTGSCRYTAGMAAWRDHRPDLFLLDDGFQHFQLARDLDIVLLDAARPFGNGRLLPAGPLREPLNALAEADVLILTRYHQKFHQPCLINLKRTFPYLDFYNAAIEPTVVRRFPGGEKHSLEALRHLPVLGFAGLAHPRVFESTLATLGTDLRGFQVFPDHYAFSPEDLAGLVQEARQRDAAALITTSKDWARLGEEWQADFPLWVLEVAARVEPEKDFHSCLVTALRGRESLWSPGETSHGKETFQSVPPLVRRRYHKLITTGQPLGKLQHIHQILFRAPNWLGDAVMSLPVLASLTSLFPAAQVTVLAVPGVAPLFTGQPGVADILPYPAGRKKWGLLSKLTGQFDLALALPNSLESALGLWLTRTPHRLGYAANARTPLLTLALKGRERLRGLHQVFYYLGLLQAFGPVHHFVPPRLHLFEAEQTKARELFRGDGRNLGGPWIGLAPGATYGPAKRWPAARFSQVGDLLQQEFQAGLVLLGGPADLDSAAEVQRHGRGRYLNLAGKTTLRQALMVLSQMKVLITNDSGLMHAAAALDVPLVALFGSTDPTATGPFSPRATVIHRPQPCSPCFQRTCSLDYACLTDISVAEVAAAARRWLEDL